MARESQGLQVLLIVFVMLAVVLGVTTYVYNKRADEATQATVAAAADKRKTQEEKTAVQNERDLLKTLIGFPERSTADIKRQFALDAAAYGNAPQLPADAEKPLLETGVLPYSRMLASMQKTIQDRSEDLLRSRAQRDDQERRFKNREAASAAAIDALVAGYHKLEDQTKQIEVAFGSGQKTTQADFERITRRLAEINAEAAQQTRLADDIKKNADKLLRAKDIEIKRLTDQIGHEQRHTEAPAGEIVQVSLATKTVWINGGRADGLLPQAQFSVASADSTDAATAVEKALVVVTGAEGDHLVLARILNDKLADPIVAGDKVFALLRTAGQ